MKAFTRPAIVATCASVAALYITGGVTQSLVTKEHYIKVFDRTMVEAVERMQAQIEELRRAKEDRQQLELRFDDVQRAAAASECSTGNGFPHRSTVRPAAGQQIFSNCVGSD